MSLVLDGSSGLYVDSAVVTDTPFTIAAWFKPTDVDNNYIIGWTGDKDVSANYWLLLSAGSVGGDPVEAGARQLSTTQIAATSTGVSAGSWQHAAGVFAGDTSRFAYLAGGGKVEDTGSAAPYNTDRVSIGYSADSSPSGHFLGKVAEVAIWNKVLSDAQIASLAGGAPPDSIEVANLVFYAPLLSDATESAGELSLSTTGSPTYDSNDHPSINPAITSVSGDDVVVDGETDVAILGSYLSNINSIQLRSDSGSVTQAQSVGTPAAGEVDVDGDLVRGDCFFTSDNHTNDIYISDGSNTDTQSITFNPASGFNVVESASDAGDETSLSDLFDGTHAGFPSLTIADTDQWLVPAQTDNGYNVTLNADGTLEIEAGATSLETLTGVEVITAADGQNGPYTITIGTGGGAVISVQTGSRGRAHSGRARGL